MANRNTPLHNAWCNMKARCKGSHRGSESYPDRGITYCDKWRLFSGFVEDMESSWQPGLTLDRIDNDGGYSKENCRWATRFQQQQNTRVSKLTMEQAREVRDMIASGLTHAKIASIFGVKKHIISDVATRTYSET